ncbi:unnamed protein product [Malus baccata var. baccata]
MKNLLMLYATRTGNALDVAERSGCSIHLFSLDKYDAVCCLPLHAISLPCLAQEGTVIFAGFWKDLLQKNLSRQWLEGLRYAVFALGNSGYQKFNFVAKKLDRRLLDLGATPIVQRGLGDDQLLQGTIIYEAALDPWMASLWNMLNKIDPSYFPDSCLSHAFAVFSDVNHIALQIEMARRTSPVKFSLDKPACILNWLKMNH